MLIVRIRDSLCPARNGQCFFRCSGHGRPRQWLTNEPNFHSSDSVLCWFIRLPKLWLREKVASRSFFLVRGLLDACCFSCKVVTLGWLKTIRATSRASNRTGRLFLDKQKQPPAPRKPRERSTTWLPFLRNHLDVEFWKKDWIWL